MSPSTLLADLRQRGVCFHVEGEQLAYRAPKGVLTPELLAQLRQHKPAIVAALIAESAVSNASFPDDREQEDSILQRFTRRRRSTPKEPFEELHPYAKHVEPIKAELLSRVNLDQRYVGGQGCYLWDENGIRFLDFVAQYGALPFGYNPARIWQALDHARDEKLPSLATNSLLDSAGALATKLLSVAPPMMEHVVFCNSGAESVEVAIKLCRAATGRQGILSTSGGFHGLTLGALSIAGDPQFRTGFGTESTVNVRVPYGDASAIHNTLAARPHHCAAVVIEPIQGEAGIIDPPSGYLRDVSRICHQFGVLFVVDEVQTGLGRTGELFGCDLETVAPDVVTLAKALGGGLMPIGAVLCNKRAYSERFGLRHSSTFAGNALACQAGLASLQWLLEDHQALIEQVRHNGEHLKRGLLTLQAKYPNLIETVRGRGYMQGIVFDFSSLTQRSGMLSFLAQEQMLIHLVVSYLLHAEHIRVAPSFSGRDVLRIEPPLIVERRECDIFLAALDRCLGVVEAGNAGALLASIIGMSGQEIQELARVRSPHVGPQRSDPATSASSIAVSNRVVGRFGFVIHLSDIEDLVRFDDSLHPLSAEQLAQVKARLVDYTDPFVIADTIVTSPTGNQVHGNFVMMPYTPEELTNLAVDECREMIQHAVSTAAQQGADIIGLGGFSSILSIGGMALESVGVPLTSGNAFTVAAVFEAIEQACNRRGVELSESLVAVVGATGQIGRAVSSLAGDKAGGLLLVGSNRQPDQSLHRLCDIAIRLEERRHQGGKPPISIDVSTRVEDLPQAQIVVACTNAIDPFIGSEHLCENAIVVDASRPANVASAIRQSRPEVTWIEGGVIQIPGCPEFDLTIGPSPDRTYACVAETMLLALEQQLIRRQPVVDIDLDDVERLATCARKHGFRVVLDQSPETSR